MRQKRAQVLFGVGAIGAVDPGMYSDDRAERTRLQGEALAAAALAIDREVYEEPYFGCHPCINTSSLKMESREIWDKFLPAVGHDLIFVDLKG